MCRPRVLLTILAVIVLGSLIYDLCRGKGWRPLPGGGEIRLMAVTHGQIVRGSTPKSIFEPWRAVLGPRWSSWLGPKPLIARMTLAEPGLVVWFITRGDQSDLDRTFDATRFLLVSDTGQESNYWASLNADGGNRRLIGVVFESAARARPRLHVRAVGEGHALDFEFSNPLYAASKNPAPEATPSLSMQADIPYALPVPGQPGYIRSPFAPAAEAIDVRGYERGTRFRCPYTQKTFLIP